MKKDNLEVNRKLDINKNNKGVFNMNNEEKRFVLPKIYKAKLETTVSKEE